MQYYDCSSWTGNWPFKHNLSCSFEKHKSKLKSLNIFGTCLSPIGSVFDHDLIGINNQLLQNTTDQFFKPVPVIDPSRSNATKFLKWFIEKYRIPMVKIIPAYHHYDVSEACLEKIFEMAVIHEIPVSIQMRMEDIRGQNYALKIDDLDIRKIIKSLSAFPNNTFILHNVSRDEAIFALLSLDNVYIDTAFMEKPDVLKDLCDYFGHSHLLFSTHYPFYYPEANIAKLSYSAIDDESKKAIAFDNAKRLFKL